MDNNKLMARLLMGQGHGEPLPVNNQAIARSLGDPLAPMPRNPARMPSAVENLAMDMTVNPLWDIAKGVGGVAQQGLGSEAVGPAVMGAMGLMVPGARGIRTFHVSPHKFDKPDISKVGTGQGAQSYGHGLYSAESRGTRDAYWDEFADKMGLRPGTPEYVAARLNYAHEGNIPAAVAELKSRPVLSSQTANAEAARILQSGDIPGPTTYEWNIRANPEQFLDWDRPIAQQVSIHPSLERVMPQRILEGASSDPSYLGQNAYRGVQDRIGVKRVGEPRLPYSEIAIKTTDAFREAGIPGIKYLDQGSRAQVQNPVIVQRQSDDAIRRLEVAHRSGDPEQVRLAQADVDFWQKERQLLEGAIKPTSNFVLFDDSLVDILRRYGLAGVPAGGAMAAALSQNGANGGGL